MPVMVKTKLFLKDMPKDIKKNFGKNLKANIADVIKGKILSGKSPVKGKKFEDYSDGYAKTKGKKSPVDMLVTGKMLESLEVKQNRKGQVRIYFKDEKAKYHDDENLARVVRRLLPSKKGEKFKQDVQNEINKELNKATKKAVKKQNT